MELCLSCTSPSILRPRPNGCRFADSIVKLIFLLKNSCIFRFQFHWNLFLRSMNNKPALVQIMTWHRTGDKPLAGPMMGLFTSFVTRRWWDMSFCMISYRWLIVQDCGICMASALVRQSCSAKPSVLYDMLSNSNRRHTLVDNKIVDHSDVVGASHVGAAPTIHLHSQLNGLGKDNCKTRRETNKFWKLVWLILEGWQ